MVLYVIQKPVMSGASMCRLVLATICAVILGCGVAPQPESIKTVAAFEVPLQSKADRELFLSILRAAAEVEGMHVDAERDSDLESDAKVSPAAATGRLRKSALKAGICASPHSASKLS
jgi:hypothetical protein